MNWYRSRTKHWEGRELTYNTNEIKPYLELKTTKKSQIELMFNNIAERYDILNRVLSFGIDNLWRKQAIRRLKKNSPKRILDIATGTGDLAILAAKSIKPQQIVGIDISSEMIKIGENKIKRQQLHHKIQLNIGDCENIAYSSQSFDAITVAFGVRNFENIETGLQEMYRVLKPGGTVIILEISKPNTLWIKNIFNFYFQYILPVLGRIFSNDRNAYLYLPSSVKAFPKPDEFLKKLKQSGFQNTEHKPLTFSIAAIYSAKK